jgi:hypothetical protein
MRITLLLLAVPIMSVTAQVSPDSIEKKTIKAITTRFPSTRFLDLQYEQFSTSDYQSDLYGEPFENGTVKSQKRFKAAMNFPVVKKDKWTLSASLRYKMDAFELDNVTNTPVQGGPPVNHGTSETFHFFSTGLNYTYYSKLFGKIFIYNASITAEGSDEGFERVNATLIGSFVLKKNESTTITAGLLVMSDNTSLSPVIPMFTYEHKFSGSKWTMDLVFPRYLYFRRPLLEKGRLTLGPTISGESFYVYPNQPGLKKVYQYNRNEIKTGFIYEYWATKNIITTISAGYNYMFNGTFRERGATNEIMEITHDGNGYVNIGVSYNPF